MIIIILDEQEPWFSYIWEQFAQANSLLTEHTILTYRDYQAMEAGQDKARIVEYSSAQKYPGSLHIPRKQQFKTDDYVWVREDLPVYRDTLAKEREGYDILYNAFIHLSRLEEWETEKKGTPIHSYAFKHPRKDKRIWKIPVVNYLFDVLEEKIRSRWPEIIFGEKENAVIEYSHDVDYIRKTPQLRIKQSLFYLFNSSKLLLRGSIPESMSKFREGLGFAVKNCDYWCFDKWRELESVLHIKSVYYFFSRTGNSSGYNPRKWLLDPSYDMAQDDRLKILCRELAGEGNRIGIHGSFASAENESQLLREKEKLENTIAQPVTKSRQHWLRYIEDCTPLIHDRAGIEEDSSLGFNDMPGFRAGIASRYHPYDHKNGKPFTHQEIPLAIMDSHLYDYAADRESKNLAWFYESAARVKKFMVSIDWHQRSISSDYGWQGPYREIAAAAGRAMP